MLTPAETPAPLSLETATSASIALLAPADAVPAPSADALARLGAALALLNTSGPESGAVVDAALKLTSDTTLSSALETYRQTLTPTGPLDKPLVQLELSRAAALPAPAAPDAAATGAQPAWWQRAFARLVTLKPHSAEALQKTDAAFAAALQNAQAAVAANAPQAALSLLSQPSLAADPRLAQALPLLSAYTESEAKRAAVTAAYLRLLGDSE